MLINTNSETGGVDNKEVSLKGGASTLEDTIKAVLEKYMRPPSLCSVQVSSASELTASTVARVKSEIRPKIQMNIDQGMRRVIRDKTYRSIKFIRNNQMADQITDIVMINGYVELPIGWTQTEFKRHMKKHIYRAYSQIRHNSQSLMIKYYMGKNFVTKLGGFLVMIKQMYSHIGSF